MLKRSDILLSTTKSSLNNPIRNRIIMQSSDKLPFSKEQLDLSKGNIGGDVVYVESNSSPVEIRRNGILLVPQPSDDPQDPLVRICVFCLPSPSLSTEV